MSLRGNKTLRRWWAMKGIEGMGDTASTKILWSDKQGQTEATAATATRKQLQPQASNLQSSFPLNRDFKSTGTSNLQLHTIFIHMLGGVNGELLEKLRATY